MGSTVIKCNEFYAESLKHILECKPFVLYVKEPFQKISYVNCMKISYNLELDCHKN